MKIQINHKLLSDSPFCDSNKELFNSQHSATEGLIKDLKNGTPTCYLISGYRGSGKSSFIKRVEHKIKQVGKQNPTGKKEIIQNSRLREVVFIHINFSRYHNQTFLLRKLIRGLYLEIKDLSSFKTMKSNESKDPINERTSALLEKLYEKTFYDTTNNYIDSNKKEVVTIFNLDVLSLAKLFLPPIFFLFFLSNWIFKIIPAQLLINFLGLGLSLLGSIKGAIEINRKITKGKIEQKDFTRKSMYDDEIADYHFFQLLKALELKNYKIVFVLDELDKVDDEDIDKLLKEMKPYLVSGTASFIAVAGQNLYYKYSQAKSIDDDVLSSVFSKFIHIPLFDREETRELFNRLIIHEKKFTDTEMEFLNSYIDYLIFESKKVPRKFISLIRQNLIWEEDLSYIDISQSEKDLKVFTKILDLVEKIDDEEISKEGFDEALRDYFIMQLFIKSHKILFSKKLTFSKSEIIN